MANKNLIGAATLFLGFAVTLNVGTAIFDPTAGGIPGHIRGVFAPKVQEDPWEKLGKSLDENPAPQVETAAAPRTCSEMKRELELRDAQDAYAQGRGWGSQNARGRERADLAQEMIDKGCN